MLRPFSLALAGILALVPASLAASQIRIQPTQPRLTRLTARVEIVDGVASTTLEQTWRNDGTGVAEAIWILPLPPGAVADGFRMEVDGVETQGEVLDAGKARGIYEDIVRRRRDPGLLEFYGRGCLRARIFPIPPSGSTGAEVKAKVVFRSLLPELLGLRRWSLALGAAGVEGLAPEQVVLDLVLHSRRALKNVYSPVAGVRVTQKSDHEASASYEGAPSQLTGGELSLFYGLSEQEFGLDLLCQKGASDSLGSFLMLVSPKRDWQGAQTLKKSITFVLDTSGSMEGAKIEQARRALRTFLESLDDQDRFNVVPFSQEPEPFFPAPVLADPLHRAAALERVGSLTAGGGTNISGALELALAGLSAAEDEPGRVSLVVFLTDGLPTVGEVQVETLQEKVRKANGGRARLFVFGVGADVNTHLLDTLALENGGARDYVREGETIDEKTRALFAKLSHPVMSALKLEVDGLVVSQRVPASLPDLFVGDRLEVLGRYQGSGQHAIRLSGIVAGESREYVYEATFAGEERANDFVPALWAQRRVAVLLDAIRLNGANPELVGEVERLGREYHIVTPYTSHLIVEEGLRLAGLGQPAGADTWSLTPPSLDYGTGGGAPSAPGSVNSISTGTSGWFLGSGAAGPSAPRPALEQLARELAESGVLPSDAPAPELERLTREIVDEMQRSSLRMQKLGQVATGRVAVDDSVYLAGLIAEGGQRSGGVAELFSRRIKDKTFQLRAGVWVDEDVGAEARARARRVQAFSPEYFRLLAERPQLAPYLALSSRLVLELGGEVLEILEPAPAEPPRAVETPNGAPLGANGGESSESDPR